jgi:maleate isomerase
MLWARAGDWDHDPGPNVNVENEMMNMRPEGVINAIDRYYVPNQKIAANADWKRS